MKILFSSSSPFFSPYLPSLPPTSPSPILFLFGCFCSGILFCLGNNELSLKDRCSVSPPPPSPPQLKLTLCCAISVVQNLVLFVFCFCFVCLFSSLQRNLCMPMDGLTVDTFAWWRHGSAFIQHSAIMILFIFVLCM